MRQPWFNTGFLPFHPGGTISSPLWNDRSTYVRRSNHLGETVKLIVI